MRERPRPVDIDRVTLGSTFSDVVTAIRAGDVDAFATLYGAFQPGLGRYLRYRDSGTATSLADRVWRDLLVQLGNFAGTEKDFKVLLYAVTMRHCTDAGLPLNPRQSDHWVLPGNSVDQAVALLGNVVAPEQGQVVVLRVVGDLDIEETAHVLRTTSGAVRLAQYRALVTLIHQFSSRRIGPAPSDETLAGFLDVSDPMPNLVFQGAVPAWQARGAVAPVARLVATARRRPTEEERAVPPALTVAVRALGPDGDAPSLERRGRWSWHPGELLARHRHLADHDAH